LRGLTAHHLHHLLLQQHAGKSFGGIVPPEEIVHGAALRRYRPRQEEAKGKYQ